MDRGNQTFSDALLVVDVQQDFLPGGALAAPYGNEILPPINLILQQFSSQGLPIFAIRDWHPPDHCPFKSTGGPWPVHCVSETTGAEFAKDLHLPKNIRILSKGTDRDQEAYSGFRGSGLLGELQKLKIHRLTIVGLTTEHCILNTVQDAIQLGFQVRVVEEGIRGINSADERNAILRMKALGAKFVRVAEGLAA